MINKNTIMGLLAMLLTFGVALAGCTDVTNGNDDGEKKIVAVSIEKITDFPSSGSPEDGTSARRGQVLAFKEMPANTFPLNTAVGSNPIDNEGTLRCFLTVPNSENNMYGTDIPWRGDGSYYIALLKVPATSKSDMFIYTASGDSPVKVSFDSLSVGGSYQGEEYKVATFDFNNFSNSF